MFNTNQMIIFKNDIPRFFLFWILMTACLLSGLSCDSNYVRVPTTSIEFRGTQRDVFFVEPLFSHDENKIVYSHKNSINLMDFDSKKSTSSNVIYEQNQGARQTKKYEICNINIHPSEKVVLAFAWNYEVEKDSDLIFLCNYETGEIIKTFRDLKASYLTTDTQNKKYGPESLPGGFSNINDHVTDSEVVNEPMEFQYPLDRMEVNILKKRYFLRKSGRKEYQIDGGIRIFRIIGFHPDGNKVLILAVPDENVGLNYALIVDISTGEVLRQFRTCSRTKNSAAFSPCGKYIAIAALDNLQIFDIETGRKIKSIPIRGGFSVFYSPDGTKIFFSGTDLHCVDSVTDKVLWTTTDYGSLIVDEMVFSADSSKGICSTDYGFSFCFDTMTGKILRKIRSKTVSTSIDYSDKKNALIIGDVDGIRIFKDVL